MRASGRQPRRPPPARRRRFPGQLRCWFGADNRRAGRCTPIVTVPSPMYGRLIARVRRASPSPSWQKQKAFVMYDNAIDEKEKVDKKIKRCHAIAKIITSSNRPKNRQKDYRFHRPTKSPAGGRRCLKITLSGHQRAGASKIEIGRCGRRARPGQRSRKSSRRLAPSRQAGHHAGQVEDFGRFLPFSLSRAPRPLVMPAMARPLLALLAGGRHQASPPRARSATIDITHRRR